MKNKARPQAETRAFPRHSELIARQPQLPRGTFSTSSPFNLDSSPNEEREKESTFKMSLSSILSSFPTLRLPHSTQERLNLVLGTAAFIGTTTVLLPAAYRDYRTFKSYGQGGVPNNVIGWLVVRLFFQPFCAEMLDTEVYSRRIDAAEGHGKGDDGYLTLSEEQLTTRSPGNRPQVGPHVVPQRQLTQLPDENIKEVRSYTSVHG